MANKVYWLISAPETGKERIFDMTSRRVGGSGQVYEFNVPEVRVGTLDALMSLSDDLVKHDAYLEGVTRKIASQLYALCDPKDHDQILTVKGAKPDHYISHFKWDEAKYPLKSCKEITDLINSQITKLDEELRNKSTEYSTIVHALAASERGQSGNLQTRDLSDIVKQDDWIDTEYLTTAFVVLSKYIVKEWDQSYETLVENVVPRSSKVILEDNDYSLLSVVLFKKNLEAFKNACRERKYVVRDFHYNANVIALAKQDAVKLKAQRDQIKGKLTLWCSTNFTEAFVGWMHLKAIRIYVESVLRYGLPANFQALLVLPQKKEDKKLRTSLNELFRYLGTKHLDEDEGDSTTGESFYPYVSININTEMKVML